MLPIFYSDFLNVLNVLFFYIFINNLLIFVIFNFILINKKIMSALENRTAAIKAEKSKLYT